MIKFKPWWMDGAAFAAMAMLVSALVIVALALTGQAKPALLAYAIAVVQATAAAVLGALASRTGPPADPARLFFNQPDGPESARIREMFSERTQ